MTTLSKTPGRTVTVLLAVLCIVIGILFSACDLPQKATKGPSVPSNEQILRDVNDRVSQKMSRMRPDVLKVVGKYIGDVSVVDVSLDAYEKDLAIAKANIRIEIPPLPPDLCPILLNYRKVDDFWKLQAISESCIPSS